MSDDHRVVTPIVSMPRRDAIVRVATVLRDHGLVFDGGIRGLHWDQELGSFSYDDEDGRDLEDLDSIDAAIDASRTWERVCLDLSGLGTSWELHASSGRTPSESSIALSFPHGLHRLASAEVPTARRLVHLLDGVRRVVGAELLVCGTDAPEPPLSLAELGTFVNRQLREHLPAALRLHTIVSTASFHAAVLERHALADYWHHLDLDGAHAMSQLPIDG